MKTVNALKSLLNIGNKIELAFNILKINKNFSSERCKLFMWHATCVHRKQNYQKTLAKLKNERHQERNLLVHLILIECLKKEM